MGEPGGSVVYTLNQALEEIQRNVNMAAVRVGKSPENYVYYDETRGMFMRHTGGWTQKNRRFEASPLEREAIWLVVRIIGR